MQVSVESGEGLEKRLLVDLPAGRVSEAMEKKLRELARHVRLDGFRPGKVPMRTIRQRFGEQVRQETYGALIQETLYEAASQQKLMPAGEPQVELRDAAEEGGLGYTAIFEVMPDVSVGDLSGQSINRVVAEVGEGDIDEMIEKLRKQRTVWNDVDRGANDGDTVHINFKGMIDGEAFEGGSAEDVPLVLGSGAMIDGFESGLLGAKPGDERTLEVTFPDDYRATHLAGKPATFEVKVLRVAEPQLPEIDEEFVKAFGVADGTVEALREDVAKNMRHELKQKLAGMTKEKVMDALIAANPMDVPKALVGQEAERMKQQMLQEMQQRGQRSSVDLPASVFEDQARRRVHLGLLVSEIIEQQGIKADEDGIRATIAELAESYEDPQEVIDYYLQDANARRSIENLVLENAVVDWALAQVQVNDETKSFSEVMDKA
ncbi:MAG: trigger factor [Gammaproteobacteria bacterium]|nr:trigger factor [Gammaproteobacteria bacterium]MCB1924362.1 trigger factor [Gammaproteobacteria bacterium]